MSPSTTVLGLDIGGTHTAVVEGTPDGRILQRDQFRTEPAVPFTERLPTLAGRVDRVLEQAEQQGRSPEILSIAVGGPLKIASGQLINPPHLPGWQGVNLVSAFQDHLGGRPIYVEHDGNAGALAEFHFGRGAYDSSIQNLVFLTFGTGIGAGLIVAGQIFHGASDTAGEVGHWRLNDEGPVGFGKNGSWEGLASGRGMVRLAARRYPERWEADSPIRGFIDAALADDPEAVEVVREAGRWLGRGMALLVDALNPDVIVLGTLARVLGDRVLTPARNIMAEEALPQAVEHCRVLSAGLGEKLGDVAALMAGLTRHPRTDDPILVSDRVE